MKTELSKEIKENPEKSALVIILLLTVFIAFIAALIQHNWISLIFSIITFFLICISFIMEKLTYIAIPIGLRIFAVVFIYASLFLGELNRYYTHFWWWDILLHTSSGLVLGIMGFLFLSSINSSKRIKASPIVIVIFTFAFALAVGALWEILEFSIGIIFRTAYAQGDLSDTMHDLIFGAIGGLVSTTIIFSHLKRDLKKSIRKHAFKKNNFEIFKKRDDGLVPESGIIFNAKFNAKRTPGFSTRLRKRS